MKTVLNKLAVFLIIALCCLPLISVSSAGAASGEEWKMSNSSSLNIRSSASTSAAVIGKIPAGTTYTVTQKVNSGSYLWGKVTYNGVTGWCALNYSAYVSGSLGNPYFTNGSTTFSNLSAVNLSWLSVQGASEYTLSLYSGKNTLIGKYTTTSTSYSLNLSAGSYYAHVKATNTHAASWSASSKNFYFSVSDDIIRLKSLEISGENFVSVNGETALSVKFTPENAQNKSVVWYSSDKTVATVTDGIVRGISYGSAVITCTSAVDNSITASFNISVSPSAPAEPVQLSGKKYNTTESVRLSWNNVDGANGYAVYVYNTATKKYELYRKTDNTKCTVHNLKQGTIHKFRIKAYAHVKSGNIYSAFSKIGTAATRPSKVKNLCITGSSENSVAFSWKALTNVTKYIVYMYDETKNDFVRIGDTQNTDFIYSTLPGKTIRFLVKSVIINDGKAWGGEESDVLETCTRPQKPTLKVTKSTSGAQLTWNTSTNATGYEIYRATATNGVYKKIQTVSPNRTSYLTKNVTSGRTYYFRIRAYTELENATVYGEFSQAITFTA